jgi:hypothetical protein
MMVAPVMALAASPIGPGSPSELAPGEEHALAPPRRKQRPVSARRGER